MPNHRALAGPGEGENRSHERELSGRKRFLTRQAGREGGMPGRECTQAPRDHSVHRGAPGCRETSGAGHLSSCQLAS